MHYIEEAGDLLGTEIKIVFTGSKLQGALPDRSGPSWGADLSGRRCKGKLNSIRYALMAGAEERVALSYWD
jgi:hypothetical protein